MGLRVSVCTLILERKSEQCSDRPRRLLKALPQIPEEGLCLPGSQSEHVARKTNGPVFRAPRFSESCGGGVWGKEPRLSGGDTPLPDLVAYSAVQ